MKKRTKNLLIVLLIILIILFLGIGIYIYLKETYSLENIKEQLISNEKNMENVYIVSEINEKGTIRYMETFIENNDRYIVLKNQSSEVLQEYFYDFETSEVVLVNHQDKTIIQILNANKNSLNGLLPTQNLLWVTDDSNYQYSGKENIEGKECIKISHTEEYYDLITRDTYYIDLKENQILKYEMFKGSTMDNLEKEVTYTYSYSYNTVTPEKLLKFNRSNYPDYTFT